ncbi:hypothetical protein Q8A67_012375 [Cirrhinus molitorella]|uniref:Dynein light chain n=1 Tax=Cirrhinus molitorella TaxID=172907 RepID=A0AA88PYA7_9TELE|nr:hypothetical protein Q8A67_012375 [Cirrhinus molitorella]
MSSIVIHDSRMSAERQSHFHQVTHEAVNKYKDDKGIIGYIKQEFQCRFGGYWHCDVGFSGANDPHEADSYIHFSVGSTRITLYKCI